MTDADLLSELIRIVRLRAAEARDTVVKLDGLIRQAELGDISIQETLDVLIDGCQLLARGIEL